jgi:hypothetical protein
MLVNEAYRRVEFGGVQFGEPDGVFDLDQIRPGDQIYLRQDITLPLEGDPNGRSVVSLVGPVERGVFFATDGRWLTLTDRSQLFRRDRFCYIPVDEGKFDYADRHVLCLYEEDAVVPRGVTVVSDQWERDWEDGEDEPDTEEEREDL